MKKDNHGVSFGVIGIVIAIGIVYGDIGTSPLYVMKAIMNALPGSHPYYVIGGVSCVIWTLTLQTTVKYVFITLRADNNGEGGILALFALVRKKFRWAYIIAAVGAATLLADGIITPSITVTSAIEGVNALIPGVSVVPTTIIIIIALFAIQPFGTAWIGKSFGIIMFLWFTMLAVLGAYNILGHLEIFKAFNPYYAIQFIVRSPESLIVLGAVFLCTTGAEALYSDLGHCGLKNIRVSWIFVKSALILNYLGQGAWVITRPESSLIPNINPFFAIMPEWFSGIGVLMATLAAIIASQALICGSFTIISEAISLDLWPNIKIKYPTEIKGQMFIPGINYILMFLCILIVLIFRSSSNMEAAYGLSITVTMLMTTLLLFLFFRIKKVSRIIAIPITIFFLMIESGFLIANLQKFEHGGFMSILIAGILFMIMYSWRNGRRIKNHSVTYQRNDALIPLLDKMSVDHEIPKFATHLIYVTRSKRFDEIESKIVHSIVHCSPKRADTYWFVALERSDKPYAFNYKITTFVPQKIFRIDIDAGFKLGMKLDKYVHDIARKMEMNHEVDLCSRYPSMREKKIEGDFKYVVVERIASGELDLPVRQSIILSFYTLIKRLSTSDIQILGLDPSTVIPETVPLYRTKKQEIENNKSLF
ncbi:MAG: KUP/HAK/KT family potassium transporter [Candidatus Azobacteroides sp.]|nr:KUP/HAK/KT family potassium transporter [Candidatus Azobacteroides sp.]